MDVNNSPLSLRLRGGELRGGSKHGQQDWKSRDQVTSPHKNGALVYNSVRRLTASDVGK